MWIPVLAIVLPVAMMARSQIPKAASDNRCAACHIRIVWTQSTITHADEWVTSKHALRGVGCEKCHGGDAKTSDETVAHRGVKNRADPSSLVYSTALPGTCGRCHRAELNEFARSAHQPLLLKGEAAAPTCTSCHSSMAADVPSPAAFEMQCLHCHGGESPDRAHEARRELEELTRLRTILKRARFAIAALADSDRRASLTTQWTNTDVSLRGVVAALHGFDQRAVEDRLSVARVQVERLGAALKGR
jgi:Cytochrome c554 and c-prime